MAYLFIFSLGSLFSQIQIDYLTHYSYYNRFTVPWTVSGTNWVNQYQKGKTNLDLLEQEIVSGSFISWAYANLHHAPDR